MSCATLNQQPISLVVSMGSLPEGFCPANFQELANAMATRLIVTPSENNSSFVTGSVEPTSNVGPWLKDCVEWWIFDDATGRYVPLRSTQFTRIQVFDSNGSWTNNFNATIIQVEAWGGGGGGGGSYGGGGGGGGYARDFFTVTNGSSYPVIVGSGGGSQADGSDSNFQGIIGAGGKGAASGGVNPSGGAGGGGTGTEVVFGNGGAFGNGGNQGGSGGGSGKGGGGAPSTNGAPFGGTAPGGGGSGGITTGGSGASGRVVIIY